ncbi:hypothetical protein ULG90_14315 [Halopseudomonas pachastrellae]|nr:hypothetical protein ULG90_14315 [Halopseudomonas pachastrellae]
MKAHRLGALIVKESRELIRDPVTIALAVIMPLIMLFLFGYAVNLDVEQVAVGIYDLDTRRQAATCQPVSKARGIFN